MPRFYEADEAGDPIDLCNECWYERGMTPHDEDEHPDYEGLGYTCEDCGAVLEWRDN